MITVKEAQELATQANDAINRSNLEKDLNVASGVIQRAAHDGKWYVDISLCGRADLFINAMKTYGYHVQVLDAYVECVRISWLPKPLIACV